MQFQISIIEETVTEESAEQGDYASSEYTRENELVDFREAVSALEQCYALSQYPVSLKTCSGHIWASTEPQMNYGTGDTVSESVFVKRADGTRLSPRAMFRLLRAAGLVKGTV